MTELDIVSGRVVCAGTFSFTGEQILTYTPQLRAVTTNPNTGTTATHQGWWVKIGNLVMCWGVIHFSGAGISPGSGAYEISLPTTVVGLSQLNFVGSGPFLGSGVIRDDSNITGGSRQVTPRLSDPFHIETNSGLFRLTVTDGTTTVVTDSAPFTWATGDRISFHCIYPAELELLT